MLATATVIAFASESLAQQSLPRIEHRPKPVIDHLSDKADVSAARVVVGLMLDPGKMPEERPEIIAGLPGGWDTACTRLLSSDALYEGLAEYPLTDEVTGAEAVLVFEINEGKWSELMRHDPGYLAVAVTEGECAAEPLEPVRHAVVRLAPEAGVEPGQLANSSGMLAILVNGQGASNVGIVAGETRGSCVPAGDEGGVGFNWICRLSLGAIPVGETEVRINRRRYGAFAPRVSVFIDKVEP